jgi:uncharacterized repeat protein (TIGR03803 family)
MGRYCRSGGNSIWLGGAAIGVALSLVAGFPTRAEAATEAVLHYFGGNPDGFLPDASLIDVKGTLYGTTAEGGMYGSGVVFSIAPDGTESVLYSFRGGSDGAEPAAALKSLKGTLYGTTTLGGGSANCTQGCGTVFSVTPDGTETVLHFFVGGSDGDAPNGSLIDVDGVLYGTTYAGGDPNCNQGFGCGTVFSITPGGTKTVLYAFKSGSDGQFPKSELVDLDGTLYGTSQFGGDNDEGTVFAVTPDGTERVVYSFCSRLNCVDGAVPYAGLTNVSGTLYGTTGQGGAHDSGTVFSITPDGTESVLHSFGSGRDGSAPFAGLTRIRGTLYGTTYYGGRHAGGTVFSIGPRGIENVLYSFRGGNGSDGANPRAGLLNVRGTLYGTTASGGIHDYLAGTVFSITRRKTRDGTD